MFSRTAEHVLSVPADQLQRLDALAHHARDRLMEYLESMEHRGEGVHRAPDNVMSELVSDVVELAWVTGETLADAERN
jgi:hypothetical protein